MSHEDETRVTLPFGLGPIAILWIFYGLSNLVTVAILNWGSHWDWQGQPVIVGALGGCTLLAIAVGVGILRLKRWAWYLGLLSSGLLLGLFVVDQVLKIGHMQTDWLDWIQTSVQMCLYLATVWLLTRPRTRSVFGIGAPHCQ